MHLDFLSRVLTWKGRCHGLGDGCPGGVHRASECLADLGLLDACETENLLVVLRPQIDFAKAVRARRKKPFYLVSSFLAENFSFQGLNIDGSVHGFPVWEAEAVLCNTAPGHQESWSFSATSLYALATHTRVWRHAHTHTPGSVSLQALGLCGNVFCSQPLLSPLLSLFLWRLCFLMTVR